MAGTALLKVKPNSIGVGPNSHPQAITRSVLGSDTAFIQSEMQGVGIVSGGFFFNFVTSSGVQWGTKASERNIEKGVLTHDHVHDTGGIVNLQANLYGPPGKRDNLYHALKRIQQELRKTTGSLAISEPFDVFPFVVLEKLDVSTHKNLNYRVPAWYICNMTFRPVSPQGSEDGQDDTAPIDKGTMTFKELQDDQRAKGGPIPE